jgi:hypothetical protein
VPRAEERSVALMTAHAFFMGCATVFFETAASAFFLARFEASVIPWVYLAAAVVNLVTGTLYTRVQARVSFARMMKGTLWLLLVVGLLVRLGFAVSNASWVVFGGLVWYRVLSSLTDLEYWAVASRIYDIGQAKRLFGLIGTGEVLARMLGAFAVPLVVQVAGVGNLMVLSAAALGLCLVLVGVVLRSAPGSDTPPAPVIQGQGRAGLRQTLQTPYLSLIVGVAIVATFGKYFVDFAFLEQMGGKSRVDVELASYLGVFAGLTQGLSLLTRLLVSRPFLARFGIQIGVMVLPLLQLLCTLALVTAGALGGGGLVFWFVLGNQGLYKTFKHPVDNASFKILYQPLSPEQRLAAQIAVEVVLAPVVVGLAGGIMLLFSAVMDYDPVRFGLVLLGNFALWSWLAWRAGRAYLQALLDRLRTRISQPGEPPPPAARDEAGHRGALARLQGQLDNPDPDIRGEALAALDALGFVAEGAARDALRGLLRDEVREAAWTLGAWRDLADAPGSSTLREALVAEAEGARGRVFAAAACCHDRTAIHLARASLDHPTRERRAYAHEVFDLALAPGERADLLPLLEAVPPDERLTRLARRFPQPAASVDDRLRQLIA